MKRSKLIIKNNNCSHIKIKKLLLKFNINVIELLLNDPNFFGIESTICN